MNWHRLYDRSKWWVCALTYMSTIGHLPAEETVVAVPAPGIDAVVLDIGLHGGYVSYEERVSIDPTVSEWQAAAGGVYGVLSGKGRDLNANLRFNYTRSLDETEEWFARGFLAQRNDMEISALEFVGEVGFPFEIDGSTEFIPHLGLGYRYQQFSRSDFQTAAPGFSDLGRVDETYDLIFLNAAVVVDHAFSIESGVKVRADIGWFLHNEAENSYVGEVIEGDGGFFTRLAADWYWNIQPDQQLGLGVYFEHQALRGSVDTFSIESSGQGRQEFIVEWPDNDLDRVGVKAGWHLNF